MSAIRLECIALVVLLFSSIFIANLHVASASTQENVNSSSIKIEQPVSNSYPLKSTPEKARVAEHKITAVELGELKSKVGVYVEGQTYNQHINGHGTGVRPPTEDEWDRIAGSAYFVDTVAYDSSPPSVDLSATPWFPPIGNQDGEGSCVAWAVGYYVKTFQEAKEHSWDLSGATWEGGYYDGHPTQSYQNRIMSPDFIYHLINYGTDDGAYYSDAIRLVCFVGASSWEKMPNDLLDYTTWPSEEAWTEAPLYRGNSSGFQYMDTNTDTGLANLKNWIASENLAIISIDANKYSDLTSEDLWTIDNYVYPITNHANTIVGYDDNMAYIEGGEVHYGAFKIANSWGIGGWENIDDGFYWISYEAMKQRIGYCMFYYDMIGYKPELAATFRISHDKRSECQITIGIGNPAAPIASKSFSQYIHAGSLPFCQNNVLLDITEFKDYVSSVYNQQYFLEVYDVGTSTTGTIHKFAVEYADFSETPRQTVDGNDVYLSITLPPLETTWTDEMLANPDQDSLDKKISTATDNNGNMYIAYEDFFAPTNHTAVFVRKSSDGGQTWPIVATSDSLDYNIGNPSIAVDPYSNDIYVAMEREMTPDDHDIIVSRYVGGSWSWSYVATTIGEDERFPSITCEYQYGSSNRQYISYEYIYDNDDRDLMFAKSTDHGATWTVSKLHGDLLDWNVHAQTSITNAEGNLYIAYKWGTDYDSLCEIRVESSTDFGSTWTQLSDVDGLPNNCQFPSIAATHGGDVVVVGFQYEWSASDIDICYSYSTNNGSTWTKGQSLFASKIEDEKSLSLVVDGEGTQSQDAAGYIHAICKVGRYAEYRRAHYSQPTNWDTSETISDGWIGSGLTMSLRQINGGYYPYAAWTDARTKDIYYSKAFVGYILINTTAMPSPQGQRVQAGSDVNLYFGEVSWSSSQFSLYMSGDGLSQISVDDVAYTPEFNVADLTASAETVYTLNDAVWNVGYNWVNGTIPTDVPGGNCFIKASIELTTDVAVSDTYIEVTPVLEVSPTSGAAGSEIVLSGQAFTASSSVVLSYLNPITSNWVSIVNTATTASGQFTYNLDAPDLLLSNPVGDTSPLFDTIVFRAQDTGSGFTCTTAIPYSEWRRGLTRVGNAIATGLYGNNTDLTSTAFVKVGQSVVVTGNWFNSGSVTIFWDDVTNVGAAVADETGFFNTTITVPTTGVGSHDIVIINGNAEFWVAVARLPVTTDDYDGEWHTSDFTIALTPDFQVSEIYYKINGGSTQSVSADGQPQITVVGDSNTLEYWSIDEYSNEELPHKMLTDIKLDKSAPTGSIEINNGASYTASTSVTLSLTATDTVSGVYQVRYSNDGSTWSSWESHSATKAWTLTSGDGAKTVYYDVKDNAGLISSYTASITLDTTAPVANAGQGQTVDVGSSVSFDASGSTDNIGIGSYAWDFEDGNTGSGMTTSHTYSSAGNYVVQLTVQDAAGNTATSTVTIVVKAPEPTPTPSPSPSPSPSSAPSQTPSPSPSSSPQPTQSPEPPPPEEIPLLPYVIALFAVFALIGAVVFMLRKRR